MTSPEHHKTNSNSQNNDGYYFDAVQEPIRGLQTEIERLTLQKQALVSLEKLIAEIDCDYGAGNLSITEKTIKVEYCVPELSGPAKDLLEQYNWEKSSINFMDSESLFKVSVSSHLNHLVDSS